MVPEDDNSNPRVSAPKLAKQLSEVPVLFQDAELIIVLSLIKYLVGEACVIYSPENSIKQLVSDKVRALFILAARPY